MFRGFDKRIRARSSFYKIVLAECQIYTSSKSLFYIDKAKYRMLSLLRKKRPEIQTTWRFANLLYSTSQSLSSLELKLEIDRIIRLINDHPFNHPLEPTLQHNIKPSQLTTHFIEHVLGRLFAAHANGLKAYEFFMFTLQRSPSPPSPSSFEKTLHILARMRYFDKAWDLLQHIAKTHPSLITLKAMSIMLCKVAKFGGFEETLSAFERFEKEIFVGSEFGTDEFNVLLRAFSTQRQMKEAKAVFERLCFSFKPSVQSMNVLLLGFKESGDVTSVELFYHEMVKRGFKGNAVSYDIRIDVYCKRGCLGDGLRLMDEMERAGYEVKLETMTTLIHGAGIVRNAAKARELFDGIRKRGLEPDIGAHNALISSLVRCRNVEGAMVMMDEMEDKGIGHDDVTYHTMFLGLKRSRGVEGVCELYHRMIDKKFTPNVKNAVMLIKFFCINGELDLGLNLWDYLMERGCCPHAHVLNILATALCSRGEVDAAYRCAIQTLERGRHLSSSVFAMLERFLLQAGEVDKLRKLDEKIKNLQKVLPPSRGHAMGILEAVDVV